MLLEQFGHDIIFIFEFSLKLFDFLILSRILPSLVMPNVFSFKDDRSLFEELLLPLIELDSVNFVLIYERRNGNSLQEVLPYNRDLFLRC